jgi:DNA-binding FadR family transcriptional regulator
MLARLISRRRPGLDRFELAGSDQVEDQLWTDAQQHGCLVRAEGQAEYEVRRILECAAAEMAAAHAGPEFLWAQRNKTGS